MSVLIKHMAMPKGCIYANDKDQTEYCPLLNHDDVPFCQCIENEPEIAIGIDERPVYCPLSDVPEPCQDAVSRQGAIDAIHEDILLKPLNDSWYRENHELVTVGYVERTLLALPSAQPEWRWIPCSEETGDEYPEEDGFYYVTEQNYGFYLDADCKQRVTHTSHFKNGDFTDRFYTENNSNITAWMPLPEPWEGEQDEDQEEGS